MQRNESRLTFDEEFPRMRPHARFGLKRDDPVDESTRAHDTRLFQRYAAGRGHAIEDGLGLAV